MNFRGYIDALSTEVAVDIGYDCDGDGIELDYVQVPCGGFITDTLTAEQAESVTQQCIDDLAHRADRAEAQAEDRADWAYEDAKDRRLDRGDV